MREREGGNKGLHTHLEEPIIEREEEGLAEEVGDGALGDGHGPQVAAAEEVGQQVAGVVEQVPLLRLGWLLLLLLLVDAGRLAPAPTRNCHEPIHQTLSLSGTNSDNSCEFSGRQPPTEGWSRQPVRSRGGTVQETGRAPGGRPRVGRGHRRREHSEVVGEGPYLKLKVRGRRLCDADGAEATEPRRGEAAAGPGSSVAAAMAEEPG